MIRFIVLFIVFISIASSTTPLEKNFIKAEKLFFQKKYHTAKSLLEKIIQNTPENAKALSLLGDIYFFDKDYKKAENLFLLSIEIEKEPAKEHFRLGQIYMYEKKPRDSIQHYLHAYKADPQLKQTLFQLGFVYLTQERDKVNTIKYWQQFIGEAPKDYQAEKIQKILELLKEKNFVIPDKNSNVSLAEALLMGGKIVDADNVKIIDKSAGHEKEKTNNDLSGLLEDSDL